MSKMRIHELAKQIEKDSKEVIKVLIDNKIEVKNHMSVVNDEGIALVKRVLSSPKEVEEKKSRITRVYNPQNSGANRNNNRKNSYTKDKPKEQNKMENTKIENNKSDNNRTPINKDQQGKSQPQNTQNRQVTNNQQGGRPQSSNQAGGRPQSSNQSGGRPQSSNQAGGRPQSSNQSGGRPQSSNQAGGRPQSSNQQGGRSQSSNQAGGKPQSSNQQAGRPQTTNQQGGKPQGGKPQGGKPQASNQQGGKPQSGNRNNNFNKKPVNRNNKQNKGQQTPQQVAPQKPKVEEIKVIVLPEVLTIKELADKMKIVPSVIVKKLFLQGKVVTINQEVDYEAAEEIALEFDVISEKEIKIDVIEELLKEEEEDEALMKPRPPVVCVMGHVDHGKTSLLGAVRETDLTTKEAGGITQHIGAYMVEANGEKITFLDTPGHEAFTSMRMRGAQSTDIAILVVAADDGVMPQTVEAINHAKAAGISIIVAINKIDKPSANIDRVKQELTEHELIPEDWGGDTIFVPVSAHTKEGIDTLLEMILLTAEISELKANPDRKGRGIVIEARLDKGKGPIATVLVQKGTLKVGDHIAVGSCHGKVRAMLDHKGKKLKTAGPSTPVGILGLNAVPNAGEVFVATENDKEARQFAETYISEGKERLIEGTKAKLSLDDLFSQIQAGEVKELNIIVKADVQGSVEAVRQSLTKLSNEQVVVKVIHGGVGAVNESDVILASASNAIIIGFNVRPDNTAKQIADEEKVDLRLYRVIYNAIEDIEAAMKGMLDPEYREKVTGHAEVRQTFKASGVGTIAGSYVLDGIFKKSSIVRLTRDNVVIYEGPLASLKRFKDDVKEVKAGYECGLVFEKFNDVKEGDQVEAYEMEEIPR